MALNFLPPQDRNQIAQRFKAYLNGVETSVLDGGDWLEDSDNPARNDFSIDLGDISLNNTDNLEISYSFDENDELGDYLRTVDGTAINPFTTTISLSHIETGQSASLPRYS